MRRVYLIVAFYCKLMSSSGVITLCIHNHQVVLTNGPMRGTININISALLLRVIVLFGSNSIWVEPTKQWLIESRSIQKIEQYALDSNDYSYQPTEYG